MKNLLVTFCIFATPAMATQLTLPQQINVLSINNQEVDSSFFSKKSEITLPTGLISISLKYEDWFDIGFEQHEIVRSKPLVIHFKSQGQMITPSSMMQSKRGFLQTSRCSNWLKRKQFNWSMETQGNTAQIIHQP